MDKFYQYLNQNKWLEWLLFIGVFWLFIVNLHLNRGLDDLIPGYHYWRKSDTYAQVLNYYYNGLNFFDHSMYYNQMTSGGKAVAEFPLFYYLVALQLKIFGNHIIILKVNWLIMLCLGMFALYQIALHFTRNHIMSLAVPLSLFLSPVFTIYALEYLPDPIALSLSCIGLFFLLKHHQNKKQFNLIMGLVFISISGLMKPFFLIPYIAYIIVGFGYKLYHKKPVLSHWYYLLPFGVVMVWFYYVFWYNTKVNCDCFLASTQPYWTYKPALKSIINAKILNKWWPDYLHPNAFITGLVLLFLNGIFLFKKHKKIGLYLVLSLLGSIAFIVLFYGMLRDHDYYVYPVLFLIPLVVLLTFFNVEAFKRIKLNYGIGLLVLGVLYISVSYSWSVRQARLKSKPINATSQFENYVDLEPFLNRHQVNTDDLIIAYSDKSPSYALSLMNRKGWSGYQTFYLRMHVSELMAQGASYIVINKALPLKRDSIALEGIDMTYIADTNQIFLYKLNR